ncbi:methionyl-tRNA formyltransferase [bacterium]|nr:methionyl-tRNA formyltransferase [bacterium]
MRVVFLGSQEIGARCLEVVLRHGHEVVGVGTDRPASHEHWADDVTRLVEQHGLRVLRGRRFRTRKAIDELKALAPDILLVIGWRWLLPAEVLALPPKGCLGIHGSLLPRLRGFAPVNWALIRGEPRTGPSLFYFDEGTDTGDLVGQRPFELTDRDDAATVRRRLVEASVALLEEHLPGLADGTAPRVPQPNDGATFGPKRTPEDGNIDWERNPRRVFHWVRGLTRPYPGAFTQLTGRRVHVWKVRPLDGAGPGPGVVENAASTDPPIVGANTGRVQILDASFEGDAEEGAFERVANVLRIEGRFDEDL